LKYLCLRDCYTNDHFYRNGDVYDLPDNVKKSEKNFGVIESPKPVKVVEVPDNPLKCPVCGRECKAPLGLASHMRTHKRDGG